MRKAEQERTNMRREYDKHQDKLPNTVQVHESINHKIIRVSL